MIPARNNTFSTLTATVGLLDTTLSLLSAAGFPDKGCVVLAGNIDPMINEVVYYTGKSGNVLTGCIRGFDGTTSEGHVLGSLVALALIAKHITDLQPKHGTTAERLTLGASLTVDDTNRPFYDTDHETMYRWVVSHWEAEVVALYGLAPREYVGNAAQVLPLNYRKADRWTDTASASCVVRVCKAAVITHTIADWVAIGKQGS